MIEGEIKALVDACEKRLLEEHFSQAHTDMIGDEEERRGYRKGIAALAIALKTRLSNGELSRNH